MFNRKLGTALLTALFIAMSFFEKTVNEILLIYTLNYFSNLLDPIDPYGFDAYQIIGEIIW